MRAGGGGLTLLKRVLCIILLLTILEGLNTKQNKTEEVHSAQEGTLYNIAINYFRRLKHNTGEMFSVFANETNFT